MPRLRSHSLPESPAYGRLRTLLNEKLLFLDGAMGTMIQGYKLQEDDFRRGHYENHPVDLKGDNELLVKTRPDVIEEIHRAFLEAGANIVETNTFGATTIAQAAPASSHASSSPSATIEASRS